MKRRTRRGTAMSEMVLVLPFLVLLLVFLLFLGRASVRMQHAAVADRYETWRRVAEAPGRPENNTELDEAFFGGRSDRLTTRASDALPRRSAEAFTDAAADGGYRAQTAVLADAFVRTLPHGQTVRVTMTREDTQRLWRFFTPTIRHQHTRLGNDWRHSNGWRLDEEFGWVPAGSRINHMPVVAETFWPDRDATLAGADAVSRAIRWAHRTSPGYGGPHVTPERW